jgi:hypothetical protein
LSKKWKSEGGEGFPPPQIRQMPLRRSFCKANRTQKLQVPQIFAGNLSLSISLQKLENEKVDNIMRGTGQILCSGVPKIV